MPVSSTMKLSRFPTTMGVKDKETGEIFFHEVTIEKDECNRAGTRCKGWLI